METNRISIGKDEKGRKQVLLETEKFVEYNVLDKKTAFHIRLLAEETLGMVAAITEEFNAKFWLEMDQRHICKLHLTASTDMDFYKKRQLIDVATNKKNASAKGFMSKIGDMIEKTLYNLNEVNTLEAQYGYGPLMYGSMGMGDIDNVTTNTMIYMWSMKEYQEGLETAREEDQEAGEAWDELEKSIVASIADDVIVGVKGDKVEMIIIKNL